MDFSKNMTIAISCLAVAGGAILALSAASPASAAAVTSARSWWHPHDHGWHVANAASRQASRQHARNLNAHNQRTIVINRFNLRNISRNTNSAQQDHRQGQFSSSAAAAAGGGGGGGGGPQQERPPGDAPGLG